MSSEKQKGPLKFGIAGYGKMGQLRHEKVEVTGRAKVVGVCDPFTKPQGLADGVHVYDDWNEMIASPDIDAVFVATVNALNKPITIAALQAGKHVFCEKPPALTGADVKDIMAVERTTHRQHGAAIHMRNIVNSRKIRVLMIDQGIHMLDLFLCLGGPFDEVQAMVSSLYWKVPGVEDNVFALLRDSKTGRVASIHSTMTQWRHIFSLEVFMERGYMVLNGLKTSSDTYGKEMLVVATNRTTAPAATWEEEENFSYETDSSWDAEIKIFLDAVEKGLPIVSGSSSHALEVMRLVDKIYAHERHEADTLYTDLNAVSV